MKRFILSHLVIVVLAVSAAFASGGNDDNNKVQLPETITYLHGNYEKFEYDNQDRITKRTRFNADGTQSSMEMFTYSGEDLVKVGSSEYSKSGNKITSNNSHLLDLNNDGYFSKLSTPWESYIYELSFQYKDGNITKKTEKYSETWDGKTSVGNLVEYTCKYDQKKSPFYHCKTPKWYMFWIYPSFSGQNNAVEDNYKGGSIKYAYVYDAAGYPIKRTTNLFDSKGVQYEPEDGDVSTFEIEIKYKHGNQNTDSDLPEILVSNENESAAPPTNHATTDIVPEQELAKRGALTFSFAGFDDLTKEEHGKIQMNVILRKTTVVQKTDKKGKSYDSNEYEDTTIGSGTLKEGFVITVQDPKSDQYSVMIKAKDDRVLGALATVVTGGTKVGDAFIKGLTIKLQKTTQTTDFEITVKKSMNNKGIATYDFISK